MTINEYQKLAMTTLNPKLSEKDILINGVMGLCGESGEAIDIVKKHLAQGHELDREHLIDELGDIAWYLAETAQVLGVTLEEVLERNMTVIISSHNLRELEDFCDMVGILHNGRLIMQHTMDTLSDRYCKAQVVIDKNSTVLDNFKDEKVLSIKKSGSIYTVTCAMSCDEAEKFLGRFNPVFMDFIPLTLEEVFVSEMEAIGYDTNNIIF